MVNIESKLEVKAKVARKRKSLLLLYKSGHLESECAYRNLATAQKKLRSVPIYSADVNTVLDIHPAYRITSIPSLLIFDKGKFKNAITGCQGYNYYKILMNSFSPKTKVAAKTKARKSVKVYSTPTCSWCTSLKTWLQNNGVKYKDIDISQDERAAQVLIKRSGHKGVPQIEINKEIVVGFQLPRLKELLEIK